jgi:hypothetical protein
MLDRRISARRPIDILFNKYLAGQPYLCRTVDLSAEGLRAEVYIEPEDAEESFALQLRLPGDVESLWVWARRVRDGERSEALEFVSLRACDQARLRRFLVPSVSRPVPVFPEELLDA